MSDLNLNLVNGGVSADPKNRGDDSAPLSVGDESQLASPPKPPPPPDIYGAVGLAVGGRSVIRNSKWGIAGVEVAGRIGLFDFDHDIGIGMAPNLGITAVIDHSQINPDTGRAKTISDLKIGFDLAALLGGPGANFDVGGFVSLNAENGLVPTYWRAGVILGGNVFVVNAAVRCGAETPIGGGKPGFGCEITFGGIPLSGG